MSAAEKLKALNLEPFAFVENESGREAVAIDLGKWRIFQHALPQIVAVVEAAERREDFAAPGVARLVADLDEALTVDGKTPK